LSNTALVVFHDHGSHRLSCLLAPGFKHVFCAVNDGNYWVTIDGRDGKPAFEVVATADYDLKSFYECEGYTVLETERGDGAVLPLALTNCVGLVKAAIGINAFGAVTPRQLFRRLSR
jgi:hypothetical protein